MSNPNPPDPLAPAPRWFLYLSVAALAAYAIFLGCNMTVAAGGSDSSGYLNSAKLLASGHLETVVRLPADLGDPATLFRPNFQPLGYTATAEYDRMVPTYPSGLPLHLALAGRLLGWTYGPLFIGVGAALAAIFLCYRVGREIGLERPTATAAAVIFAACPVLLFSSVQPLSDTLATTWCLAAVFAGFRTRRHTGWAVACGAAYGMAVLVRPTNIALLPALLVLLGFNVRRLALAVVGGLPFAGWLAFYNHTLYGGALHSGYVAVETAFAASYVAPTAWHFLRWFAVFLPAILLPFPVVSLFRPETRTRTLLVLLLWFGAITTVYLFYAISHEDWTCLRFVLPAMPALILASLLGLDAASRWLPSHWPVCVRASAAILLIGWAIAGSWYWTRKLGILYTKGYEEAYAEANLASRDLIPTNAVVVSAFLSGSVYFYTDFPILRWDHISTDDFVRYAGLAQKAGRPVCAILHESEEEGALRGRCPGNWIKIGKVKSVSFWRLETMPSAAAK
jgi:hypothetical protein